jgi:glycosyltransferase involved in cell wall biosynthesis
MKLLAAVEAMEEKSEVLYPGIDFTEIDAAPGRNEDTVPVIVWNHRWEHDKNPDEFFGVLETLKGEGLDFKLILLGQSFQTVPCCFNRARDHFKVEIVHYGFVASYSGYISLLKQGDIVVSTSLHEFYGISVIEALRAGCLPLLPGRLSYPELFENKFLYRKGKLEESLRTAVSKRLYLDPMEGKRMTDKFSWKALSPDYERWLLG